MPAKVPAFVLLALRAMKILRSLLNTALVTALIIVSGTVWPALSAPTQSSEDDNRQEAERLWELAIAAKGGRDRLHAVRNLQISIRDKYWFGLRRLTYLQEALYVFPGKTWEWTDQKGTVLGFRLMMYNQDRDIALWYLDDAKNARIARPVEAFNGSRRIHQYEVQLKYFMETKWVKPIPVSVQQEKLDGKSVDIVQTIVKGFPTKDGANEQRVGFALDRKTHLPIRVIYYRVVKGEEREGKIPLSDYVDVNGIQVPSKIHGLTSTVQINVDYDEQVFVREPNVEGGIKQWSKK